ncbi:MAG: hypothetical protein ACJA0H_002459, partial [Francisellaceae bacterium]
MAALTHQLKLYEQILNILHLLHLKANIYSETTKKQQ